jgi:L-malate glycosyltransferase
MAYRWSRNKWVTLALYLANQMTLFIKILSFSRKKDIIYLNSLLPFGAALAGRLLGCKVVYHVHEVSIRPAMLKNLLVYIMNATAHNCLFVSKYCREQTQVRTMSNVIYNALPLSFTKKIVHAPPCPAEPFTVLMVCSLKLYKGVMPFLACAEALPGLRFELVLNAGWPDIDRFFANRQLPHNVRLFEAQTDIHPFYARASVVLNLSIPDLWVETFGMTVLEAMYYGRPVIVPPVGGVTELVEDGCEGFYVDSRRIGDIVTAICMLVENAGIYRRMARAAYRKAQRFSKAGFERGLTDIFKTIHTHEKEKDRDHWYGGYTRQIRRV